MVAIVSHLISFSINTQVKYIASIVSGYGPLEHTLENYFSRKVCPFESVTLITVQTTGLLSQACSTSHSCFSSMLERCSMHQSGLPPLNLYQSINWLRNFISSFRGYDVIGYAAIVVISNTMVCSILIHKHTPSLIKPSRHVDCMFLPPASQY